MLTGVNAFYAKNSRARDRTELVTDDAWTLRKRLEAVTGERASALAGAGEEVHREREAVVDDKARERDRHENSALRRIDTARKRDDKNRPGEGGVSPRPECAFDAGPGCRLRGTALWGVRAPREDQDGRD